MHPLDILFDLGPLVTSGEGLLELPELIAQFSSFHPAEGFTNDVAGIVVAPTFNRPFDKTAQLSGQ